MKDNPTILVATLWLAVNTAYPTSEIPARHQQEKDSAINGKNVLSLKTEQSEHMPSTLSGKQAKTSQ